MDKFEIGQKVRIKAWYEMAEEYGLDDDGDIALPVPFTQHMEYLCGRTAIISDVADYILLKGIKDWVFTPEMLECIKPGIRRSL